MLGRTTTAKLTFDNAGNPNSRGNFGVSDVVRTGAGVYELSLQYGYSPDTDFVTVGVLGANPGTAQVEPVAGDTSKIRVRVWEPSAAPPVPADLAFSIRIDRDTLLSGTQNL